MGQNVREEMARLRKRYSKTFGVPIEAIAQEECLNADGQEYGRIQAEGFPAWTTGVLLRRSPAERWTQRSK